MDKNVERPVSRGHCSYSKIKPKIPIQLSQMKKNEIPENPLITKTQSEARNLTPHKSLLHLFKILSFLSSQKIHMRAKEAASIPPNDNKQSENFTLVPIVRQNLTLLLVSQNFHLSPLKQNNNLHRSATIWHWIWIRMTALPLWFLSPSLSSFGFGWQQVVVLGGSGSGWLVMGEW